MSDEKHCLRCGMSDTRASELGMSGDDCPSGHWHIWPGTFDARHFACSGHFVHGKLKTVYRHVWNCEHPLEHVDSSPCPTCGRRGHLAQNHAGWDPTQEGHG